MAVHIRTMPCRASCRGDRCCATALTRGGAPRAQALRAARSGHIYCAALRTWGAQLSPVGVQRAQEELIA